MLKYKMIREDKLPKNRKVLVGGIFMMASLIPIMTALSIATNKGDNITEEMLVGLVLGLGVTFLGFGLRFLFEGLTDRWNYIHLKFTKGDFIVKKGMNNSIKRRKSKLEILEVKEFHYLVKDFYNKEQLIDQKDQIKYEEV